MCEREQNSYLGVSISSIIVSLTEVVPGSLSCWSFSLFSLGSLESGAGSNQFHWVDMLLDDDKIDLR